MKKIFWVFKGKSKFLAPLRAKREENFVVFKGKLRFSRIFSREARRNFEVFKGKSIVLSTLFARSAKKILGYPGGFLRFLVQKAKILRIQMTTPQNGGGVSGIVFSANFW